MKQRTKERKEFSRGITRLTVAGFKSINSELSIQVKPLTVLAGGNSSGKSSLIQPLLMMKQTIEAPYDPGPLLLYGTNVRFTSSDQFLTKTASETSLQKLAIGVEINSDESVTSTFVKSRSGVELDRMKIDSKGKISIFAEKMDPTAISAAAPKEFEDIVTSMSKELKISPRWGVERERCFFSFVLKGFSGKSERILLRGGPLSPVFQIQNHLAGIIHVPGLRGNPERTYPVTAIGGEYPGVFQNYVASLIHRWQSKHDNKLTRLGKDLEALGLTWKVAAHRLDDVQVELRVGRLPGLRKGGARDLVSIADVGFGVSQTMPVLVALLAARPEQLVYIEEPEIHLHPKAQASLAGIFLRAANRGVRVIVETHSSIFLRKLQALVASHPEYSKIVALHWFDRDANGFTKVSSAELDKNGAFGAWPSNFDEISLQVDKEYLDAGSKR